MEFLPFFVFWMLNSHDCKCETQVVKAHNNIPTPGVFDFLPYETRVKIFWLAIAFTGAVAVIVAVINRDTEETFFEKIRHIPFAMFLSATILHFALFS